MSVFQEVQWQGTRTIEELSQQASPPNIACSRRRLRCAPAARVKRGVSAQHLSDKRVAYYPAREKPRSRENRGEAFCFRLGGRKSSSQKGSNSLLSHLQQGRGPQAQGDGAQGGQGDGHAQRPR